MATVLIAEDDVLIRDLTQAMIEDCDHATLLAAGVDAALSILRQPTPIDVLFTDIRLNDAIYGGCELARQARALRPGIGIVYATGHLDRAMKALLIRGAPLLLKPYSLDQVRTALAGALDR